MFFTCESGVASSNANKLFRCVSGLSYRRSFSLTQRCVCLGLGHVSSSAYPYGSACSASLQYYVYRLVEVFLFSGRFVGVSVYRDGLLFLNYGGLFHHLATGVSSFAFWLAGAYFFHVIVYSFPGYFLTGTRLFNYGPVLFRLL